MSCEVESEVFAHDKQFIFFMLEDIQSPLPLGMNFR